MVALPSLMRRPLLLRWSRWLPVVALTATAGVALADDKIDALIQQLKTSEEFRVRTQAALALGVTKDPAALKPLCDALDDAHEAVRGASAAALGKLSRPEGVPCLQSRDPKENDSKVKAQIAKSIKALEAIARAAQAPDKGEIPAGAKWYVSIGKVNNKTSRSADDIEALVRSAISKKLRALDGYAIAPRGEKPDAAKKILQAKKLRGFEFQVTVDAPVYEENKVSIKLGVLITTYPGKDIKAASSPRISQEGVRKNDPALEDQLLRALLENSVEKFDKSVDSM